MQLQAEFTTEPFREADPPQHALRARDIAIAAGLEVEFGPFGTTVRGERDQVLDAVGAIARAAFDGGASRITMQLERAGGER
ncbi:MAG: thiamine-binding protein [Sciscionella sp.]